MLSSLCCNFVSLYIYIWLHTVSTNPSQMLLRHVRRLNELGSCHNGVPWENCKLYTKREILPTAQDVLIFSESLTINRCLHLGKTWITLHQIFLLGWSFLSPSFPPHKNCIYVCCTYLRHWERKHANIAWFHIIWIPSVSMYYSCLYNL